MVGWHRRRREIGCLLQPFNNFQLQLQDKEARAIQHVQLCLSAFFDPPTNPPFFFNGVIISYNIHLIIVMPQLNHIRVDITNFQWFLQAKIYNFVVSLLIKWFFFLASCDTVFFLLLFICNIS